jgi:hypothetical protein
MHPMTEEQIEQVAKTCHEVNRAYCRSIGDNSQPSWKDAPEWQKKSARNGVMFVATHLHVENPSKAAHENWMEEKRRDGWVYGVHKNPEFKTHPCMIPYEQLSVEQRRKDDLFTAVVRSFL